MATERAFVDYVAEQAALGARLDHRRMFGEYALYVDGKVVAFACDDRLFVKPTVVAATLAPELPHGPPYPGAKDYPIADELIDDGSRLRALLLAIAEELPLPKPKRSAAAHPSRPPPASTNAASNRTGQAASAKTRASGPARKKAAAKKPSPRPKR